MLCTETGYPVQHKYEDQQNNRCGISLIHVKSLTGKHIHMYCQGASGSHQTGWNLRHRTGSINQGCSLTNNTSCRKYHTGKDSRNCTWKHHFKHGAELSCPKAKGSFSVRIRDTHKCLLCSTDDQRKDHNHHCHSSRQKGISPMESGTEKQKTEQTEDNGWNSLKSLCCNTDDLNQLAALFRIFNQINCCKNSKWHCDRQR